MRWTCYLLVLSVAVAGLMLAGPARADRVVIKNPGQRVRYALEAEPHVMLGFIESPGKFGGPGKGFGPGFRGSIVLVENGFIDSINNSIALGFGADWMLSKDHTLALPVVMQWNFWVTERWSVFAEPGGMLAIGDKDGVGPVFFAGGRFQFTQGIAFTVRGGHPYFSAGLSLML